MKASGEPRTGSARNSCPDQIGSSGMRILLVVHQFFPEFAGGTEVLTRSVAHSLARRGHEISILAASPTSEAPSDESRHDTYNFEGLLVHRFRHAYTRAVGQSSMMEMEFDNHLAGTLFERILREFKPNLVHFFHFQRHGANLVDIAVDARIPCFYTPTDYWAICATGQLVLAGGRPCDGPTSRAGNCAKHLAQLRRRPMAGIISRVLPDQMADLLVRASTRWPVHPIAQDLAAVGRRARENVARLNRLTTIFSPSSEMTRTLCLYGVNPDLIRQSPYGIDPIVPSARGTAATQRVPGRLSVAFIGTLAPHKGCHVLVGAFNGIAEWQADLKIFGDPNRFPDYFASLKRLADGATNIEFCDTFPNSRIGQVLANFDALVVPSIWRENTPLVVIAALAAHCPVIASDTPGLTELVKDRVNGLLFQAGNPPALRRKLTLLWENKDLLSSLRSGCDTPRSTEDYVDELLDAYP